MLFWLLKVRLMKIKFREPDLLSKKRSEMQFLVLAYDCDDVNAIDRRIAARKEHIEVIDTLKSHGKVLYAAAILNEQGQMCGSMLVTEFENRSELNHWLEIEPYVVGKVWDKIEVRPCKVGPSFEKL